MRLYVVAAVSLLAVVGMLGLSVWLLTRPDFPEDESAVRALPADPSLGTAEEHPVEESNMAEVAAPPPVASPKPPVPASLAGIFDETRDGIARMRAVDALPSGQPPEALTALRWLLRKSDDDEALRNNVANKLRQCGEEHLVADLTRMAWDDRETPKWRNYCIQHLYACYEQKPDPVILDTLFEATGANEKMVRICAVWSLARVATPRDKRKMPDEETLLRICAAALAALREKDAHFLITTAGVQSCARLGLKQALPDIRKLANDDNTKPTHLRIVSIAALGDLGDESDIPLLERLATSGRGQLKSAAALAAKKIKTRAAEVGSGTGVDKTPAAPSKGVKEELPF